ncbi:hypothetical protein AAC387_Pa03g1488 [Persea americana]
MEASSIEVACNVIVQDDSAFEAPSAEVTDSQNGSGSISSAATYSRVTSTEIAPSQPSSPETVTSEFKPLPTDHHEEVMADEIFKENPVNWSQIPNLIGDVRTDEILDKEEKLLEAVQDLFPENALCNAITEDGNAAAEAFSANGEDQPLEPKGGLLKEEPRLEAFEVGKGTRFGRDYHKNYNQPSSSSYVNPSGKQAVNAPSGGDNENAGLKEAFKVTKSKTSSKEEKKEARGPCTECLSVQKAASATIAFNKEDLLLSETKHNRPLYFTGYIKEMPIHRVQIDPGSALNLISTSALEELGIPPSKLRHTSVSIFGYDGSTQRPIGEIRFRLQIGDLISEVTVYAIKSPSCYNILLGRPWIHENGVVPSTLHQCIKFVGDDGLIHRVFVDKKPFKGKEVHFADSQIYKDEKEKKESPFAISFKSSKPLVITTKAKKTKQKTGGKFAVSFVSLIQDTDLDSGTEDDTSSSQADTQQVRPALTPLETPADVEDPASATFVIPEMLAEDKPIFFHRLDASSSNCLLEPFQNEGGRGILTPLEPTLTKSQLEDWKLHCRIDKSSYGLGSDPDTPMRQLTQRLLSRFADQASTSHVDEDIDLPGYLFEELPNKDPGSSSNWYDFSDDEEELSDDTDARFSDSEEPSSPKEVPYFDPVSAGDWDHLIASLEKNTDQEDLWTEAEPWSENTLGNPQGLVDLETSDNVVEEPPSNLPTEDSVQKIDLGTLDNPRPVFISKNVKDEELPEYVSFLREFVDCFAWSYAEMPGLDPKIAVHKLNLQANIKPVKQGQRIFRPNVMDKIEQEVQKLKNVGFIREEHHPERLANIVPVTEKWANQSLY